MKRLSLLLGLLFVLFVSGPLYALLLLSEGFNDVTLPVTWTVSNTPASVTPLSTVSSSTSPPASPYEGARFVRYNSYNMRAGTNTHLITPAIATTDRTNIYVTFAWFGDTGMLTYWDRLYLRWSADGTNWADLAMYPRTNSVSGWQLKTCPLSDAATNLPALYLDFFFISAYGNNCYLDAVKLYGSGPLDVEPASNLVAVAQGPNQIDLSWNANPGGDAVLIASNGVATFGTPGNGIAYPVGTTLPGGGVVVYQGSALTLQQLGLTPATRYYYAAYSVSSATNYSVKITADATTDFQLMITQGFNNVAMPDGWTQTTLSNNFPVTFVANNAYPIALPYEGTRFVLFNSFSAPRGSRTRLMSPYFCPSTTVHQIAVQFAWHHDPGYSTASNEGVMVEWTTNNVDWYAMGSVYRYSIGKTGWYLKTLLVPAAIAAAGRARIGFEFVSEYGNNCSLDAVRIGEYDPTGVVRLDTLLYERADSTTYYWNVQAINQSDAVPADLPTRADVLQIVLTNFYSNTEPDVTNTPAGWQVVRQFLGPLPWANSITNMWWLMLDCTNPVAALRAGATADVTVATYSIPEYEGVITDMVAAAAYFDPTAWLPGWLPVEPGWMGPIKGMPEPAAGLLTLFMMCRLQGTIGRRRAARRRS